MNEERKNKLYSDKRWYGQLSDMRTIEKGHPTKKQQARWDKFTEDCLKLIEKRERQGKP